MCFDYKNTKHITQNSCIHDCIKENQKGLWSHSMLYPSDIDGIINETYIYDKNILNKCQKNCNRKNCQHLMFTKRIKSEKEGATIIYVEQSTRIIIKTNTLPAIPFITFITNFLSTFGIWTGISLLSLGLNMSCFLKLIPRLKLKVKPKQQRNKLELHEMDISYINMNRKRLETTIRRHVSNVQRTARNNN